MQKKMPSLNTNLRLWAFEKKLALVTDQQYVKHRNKINTEKARLFFMLLKNGKQMYGEKGELEKRGISL